MQRSVQLIAAADKKMGIGKNNTLPWRLKKEMAYFTKMSSTAAEGKKNAVVMGRKTWEAIPPKYKPLPGRINIIVSTTMTSPPEGKPDTYVATSLEGAMDLIEAPPLEGNVDKVWVIGGHQLYDTAMKSTICHRIYLTRIDAEYDCDTVFPDIDETKFKLVEDPQVDPSEQEEAGVKYTFKVYEKN